MQDVVGVLVDGSRVIEVRVATVGHGPSWDGNEEKTIFVEAGMREDFPEERCKR
jgi:hypothetical protein